MKRKGLQLAHTCNYMWIPSYRFSHPPPFLSLARLRSQGRDFYKDKKKKKRTGPTNRNQNNNSKLATKLHTLCKIERIYINMSKRAFQQLYLRRTFPSSLVLLDSPGQIKQGTWPHLDPRVAKSGLD